MLYVSFLAAVFVSVAQCTEYGSDFYLGTMRNYQGNTNSYKLYLSTLETSTISYQIRDINNNDVASGTLSKTSPATVSVSTGYVTNTNTERSDGLHLTSTGPISVLVVNWQPATIGEYPAYPKQTFSALQYEYYVSTPDTNIVSSAHSEVLLVGTEDGTIVTITPTESVYVPSDVQTPGSPQVLLLAGQTKQFTLNRLQTFFFGANAYADMTGTSVVSNKPLTVISGNECANIPANKPYCEHVEEQIPPTITWGKKHLIRAYTGKNDYSYFLIVSSEDATTVKHNCGGTTTSFSLNLAGYKSTISAYTDTNCYIESDKPILVTQMMTGGQSSTGDPAISIIPPIDHYTNKVIFHTPNFDQVLNSNYINIVMQTTDTIMFDGSPLTLSWEPISGFNGETVGYSAELSVSVDVHDIYSSGGEPFFVLVYGYASSNLAGYSFTAGIGILKQLVGGKLEVKPWYGTILGNVPFLLKGPAFAPEDVITCQFNEVNLPCEYVDEEYAICVSPRLTFTRRISIKLFQNGNKFASNSRFYSLRIESNSVNQANIMDNHFFLLSTQQATLVWNQNRVIPSETGVDTTNLKVNVTLYEVTGQDENIVTKITDLATGIQNTGELQITIPATISENHIDFCAIFVSVFDHPDTKTVISDLQSEIGVWGTNVWVAFSPPDYIDDILFDKCNEWATAETNQWPNIRQMLLSRTSATPCPPTRAQARTPNSGLVKETQQHFVEYFHSGAGECYVQRTITSANQGSGNECCYTTGGNLIVGPGSGGSINKIDPRGTDYGYWDTIRAHFTEDVVPYLFCCKGAKKNCQAYYDRRPSDDGSRFSPPVPAIVFGDPHIVTLDLFKYTFNGRGEFVLVETPNFEPSFTIHGRMVPVKDSNNMDGKATVFSAIVAKQGDSDAVQFELQGSGDDIKIVTYVAGEEIDFDGVDVQEFNNVTVTDTGNNTLNAIFSTGAYVTVAELNGLISTLIVYLPDMYREKTQGLMGNYNNDTSDDLLRKGTTLPLSPNAGLKQIHEWFGMSYVMDGSTNNTFTYNNGDSFATYYHPDYVPLYETTFSSDDLEQQAIDICGTDKFCLFDIAVSGKVEIGEATKKGSDDFVMLQELSKPIVCNPPCVHGACVEANLCSCSEGYSGDLCDQMNADECTSFNPCLNGATCGVIAGSVVCTCDQGYIGYYCESIDESNPPTTSISTMVQPSTAAPVTTSTTSSSRRGGGSSMAGTAGGRSASASAPPTRPTVAGSSTGLSTGESAAIIAVVVIVIAAVVIAVVLIAVVLLSKRKKNIAKKYPVEDEMVDRRGMGKVNPAYEQMEEEEDGNSIYDNVDEKKLVD